MMTTRSKRSYLLIGVLAMLFILGMTPDVYAQEGPSLHIGQNWAGETVHKASLNWADLADPSVAVTVPQQPWAGETVHGASLNWADFAGPRVVTAPEQQWSGEAVHQASLNWADFVDEPGLARATD